MKYKFHSKNIKCYMSFNKNRIFVFKKILIMILAVTFVLNCFSFVLPIDVKAEPIIAPILPDIVETSNDNTKIDGIEQVTDYDWYLNGGGTDTAPYIIKYGDELAALARIVNGTFNINFVGITKSDFQGKYIKLESRGNTENDKVIDLINYGGAFYWDTEATEVFIAKKGEIAGNKGWMPIGNSADNPFRGSFDGNNIEIRHLSGNAIEGDIERANFGLFGNVDFSKTLDFVSISNVVLTGIQLKSCRENAKVGAVVGNGILNTDGFSIMNCIVKSEHKIENSSDFTLKTVMIGEDNSSLGGIIGVINGGRVLNCNFTGKIELENPILNSSDCTKNMNSALEGKAIGGIVGRINGSSEISNNNVDTTFNVRSNKSTGYGYIGINTGIGGIVGVINVDTASTNFNNNIVTANLVADYAGRKVGIGGIIGFLGLTSQTNTLSANINNCITFTDYKINVRAFDNDSDKNLFGGYGGVIGSANGTTKISKTIANVNIDASGARKDSYANMGGAIGSVNAGESIPVSIDLSFTMGTIKGNLSGSYQEIGIGGIYGKYNKSWGLTQNSILNCCSNVTIDSILTSTSNIFKSGGFSGTNSSSPNMFAKSYFSGFLLNSASSSFAATMNEGKPEDVSLSYYDYQNSPSNASIINSNINTDHSKFIKSFTDITNPTKTSSLTSAIWNYKANMYPSLKWVDSLAEGTEYSILAKALSAISTTRKIEFDNADTAYSIAKPITLKSEILNLPTGATATVSFKKADGTLISGNYSVTGDEIISNEISLTVNEKTYIIPSKMRLIKRNANLTGNGIQNGEYNTPYELQDTADVNEFSKLYAENKSFVGMSAKQTGSTYNFDSSSGPLIGNGPVPFTGVYDGGSKPITMNSVTFLQDSAGFFTDTKYAKIINMNISSASVTSNFNFSGILVGKGENINIENSTVLGVINGSQSNNQSTGGIIGNFTIGEINNVSFTGSVNAAIAGGIAGQQSSGTITNCYTIGNIGNDSTGTKVGGITGSIIGDKSIISNSIFVGNISGIGTLGGIVGEYSNRSSESNVSNCNVKGTINSFKDTSMSGGIVGNGGLVNKVNVKNCYFVGQINGAGKQGGLSGNVGTFTNCYFDKQLLGDIPALGDGNDVSGSGLTTSELAAKSIPNFTNTTGTYPKLNAHCSVGDSENVVNLASKISYDLLNNIHAYNLRTAFKINQTANTPISNTDISVIGYTTTDNINYTPIINDKSSGVVTSTLTYRYNGIAVRINTKLVKTPFDIGNGTAAKPYEIPSETVLQEFRAWINNNNDPGGAYYKLTKTENDGVYNMGIEENWIPIGTSGASFRSNFDGNNKTVSGIKITSNNSTENTVESGFFGSIINAEIKNLIVDNISINISNNDTLSATFNAGLLGATILGSKINNITTNGNIIFSSTKTVNNTSVINLGGVGGIVKNILEFNNVYTTAKIDYNANSSTNTKIYMGGLSGTLISENENTNNITNFVSYVDITGELNKNNSYGSPVVGELSTTYKYPVKGDHFIFSNVFASGIVKNVMFSGGIAANVLKTNDKFVGFKVNNTTVTCDFVNYYTAANKSAVIAGGLFGTIDSTTPEVFNVIYAGKIDDRITNKGGIIGKSLNNSSIMDIGNSYYDNSKNDFGAIYDNNIIDASTAKTTKFLTEELELGYDFVREGKFYPYSPYINTADANQFGNGTQKTNAINTIKANTIPNYYAIAENGVSSVYILTENASMSKVIENTNTELTVNGKRLVSTSNSEPTNNVRYKVDVEGNPSPNKKIVDFLPNTDSTGKTDTSYYNANPTGDGINGVNSFTLYTADSLAGLSLIVKGNAITDGQKNDFNGSLNTQKIYLGKDINAEKYSSFPIIGSSDRPFKNTFDGNYYIIKNLKISSNEPNIGLFGVVDEPNFIGEIDENATDYQKDSALATIKNTGMTTSNILYTGQGSANVGSFVGSALNNVKIDSCFSTATVSSTNSEQVVNLGGFVGNSIDTNLNISNSFFTGNVIMQTFTNTNTFSGGFIGNENGIANIKRSYVAGFIDGSKGKFGVIAGKSTTTTLNGVHSDISATGNINAVGQGSLNGTLVNLETNKFTVTNANKKPNGMNNVFPSGTDSTFLYKVGNYPRLSGFGESETSYAVPINLIAHSRSVTAGNISNTNFQLYKPSKPYITAYLGTYDLTNATSFTKVNSGRSTILIQNRNDSTDFREVHMELKCFVDEPNSDGSYNISNAYELLEFSKLINGSQPDGHIHILPQDFNSKTFHIVNNIDLSQIGDWSPVGSDFKGTLDGDGNVISNMKTSVGLFSELNGGTVNNLGFNNCNIAPKSDTSVGLLAGNITGSAKVNNCYNMSDIIFKDGTYTNVTFGGIIGEVKDSLSFVSGCYNMGAISALNSGIVAVGGIVGKNIGNIENSYNTGMIYGQGDSSTTKIAGISADNSGNISNCYNAALLKNSSQIKPIAVGTAPLNCFYDKQINTSIYDVADGIPLTTNNLKNAEFSNENIWKFSSDYYPRLLAFENSENKECMTSSMVSAVCVDYIAPTGLGTYDNILRVQLLQKDIEKNTAFSVKKSESSILVSQGSFDIVTDNNTNILNPKTTGATYVSIYTNVNGKEIKREFMFHIEMLLSVKYKFSFEGFSPPDSSHDSVNLTENKWQIPNENMGTAGNPCLIATKDDLSEFSTYVNNNDTTGIYFKLVSNIDMVNASFAPIGTDARPFNGFFDGSSFEIRKLSQTGNITGLFGTIGDKGKVKQVGLINQTATINGVNKHYTAGLISAKNYGVISNCFSKGKMSISKPTVGYYVNVGGVAGINEGRITGCYIRASNADNIVFESAADKKEYTNLGALVGNNSGYINGCYVTINGKFTYPAKGYVLGGINTGTISNTFFDSTITNSSTVALYVDKDGNEVVNESYAKTTAQLKKTLTDESSIDMAHQLSWDLYLGTYEFISGKNDGYPVCGGDLLATYNLETPPNSSIIFNLQNRKTINSDEYNASNAVCSYMDFNFPQFGKLKIGESLLVNLLDLPNNLSYKIAKTTYYGYNKDGEIKEIYENPTNPISTINPVENCNRLEVNITIKKENGQVEKPWGVYQSKILPN